MLEGTKTIANLEDDKNEEKYPKGCYITINKKAVYFNDHSTGNANIQARGICKGKGI